MTQQSDRRAASRRKVLEAAAELFRSQGVEATSMDDIAAAAGVARGTLYYNFAGKDELVASLALVGHLALQERVQPRVGRVPAPRLLAEALRELAAWTEENPHLARAAYTLALTQGLRGEPGPAGRPSFRRLLAEVIAAGQEAGELRADVEAYDLAVALTLIVVGETLTWLAAPRPPGLKTRTRRCLDLFLKGALPR
ncbi:MAG: TetR family transcriptional regulator [Planctomycetota bacterium]